MDQRKLTALEISLGVDTLPGACSAANDTASRLSDRAVDLRREQVTLVVVCGLTWARFEGAALSIALFQRPRADTFGGEEDGKRLVPS